MKTYVEFKSDIFPPYEGEESEVNPGRWGKRLAEFLADGLKVRGIEVLDIIAEDWGWRIPIANDDFDLWIGCGNYDEYPDGFLCFVEPGKPYVRRFLKKISTVEKVQTLIDAFDSIISNEPGIKDIGWWTKEDFEKGSE
jgi:hypothetical protein